MRYGMANGVNDSEQGWIYRIHGVSTRREMLVVSNEFTDGFGSHFDMEENSLIEITKEQYDQLAAWNEDGNEEVDFQPQAYFDMVDQLLLQKPIVVNVEVIFPGVDYSEGFPGLLEAFEYIIKTGNQNHFLVKLDRNSKWKNGPEILNGYKELLAPVEEA